MFNFLISILEADYYYTIESILTYLLLFMFFSCAYILLDVYLEGCRKIYINGLCVSGLWIMLCYPSIIMKIIAFVVFTCAFTSV